MGGQETNPAWFHNLIAHPDVEVQIGGERRPVRARRATQAEADALWPQLTAMWPAWDTYKTRTDREFPVFFLEPRKP
jgi:deazaflavin-dependent oxidoreductase (nitroreductase family)